MFLVISITENIVTEATKNLMKTNVKGVIYCKPIFMEGKEVPHKKPAKTVYSIAFFLVFASIPIRKGFTLLFNLHIMFLRFSDKT